jgi:hypothetical protein
MWGSGGNCLKDSNVRRSVLAMAMLLAWTSGITGAAARPPDLAPLRNSTCDLIESSAELNGLPVAYFTRLIWQESSFRAAAVSPKGAQGIAQFMPGTAAERGLADPFDPHQAIPAAAQLLKHLTLRFGNLGLAAAAYNSGAGRVDDWLAGTGNLPQETRAYVAAVTRRPVEEWKALGAADEPEKAQQAVPTTCPDVLAGLAVPPSAAALQAPAEEGEWQPWGVQLAANFSQSQALAAYRSLQQRHPTVLGGRAPMILRRQNLSFGPRARVHIRVAAPTREAANHLCHQLRAKGAACIVLKN